MRAGVTTVQTATENCRRLTTLWLIAALFASTCSYASGPTQTQRSITFSCSLDPKTNHFQYFFQLYKHAFNRLGYEFSMQSMPALREVLSLKSETVDGVRARTDGILEYRDTQGLVRVNEVIAISKLVIRSHSASLDINPDDLTSFRPYTVGYKSGYLGLQAGLQKAAIANIVSVDHAVMGLKQVSQKRLDLYIDQEIAMQSAFKQEPLLQQLTFSLGEYKSRNVYAYLLPRHQLLAPELEAALKHAKKIIAPPELHTAITPLKP